MARYRAGRRDFLLHASILALTATATSLNMARVNHLEALQALGRHMSPPPIAIRVPRLPPIPRLTRAKRSAPEAPAARIYAEPASVAILTPVIEAPAVAPTPAPPPPVAAPPAVESASADEVSPAPEVQVEAPPAVSARAVSVAYLRTAPSNAAIISGSLPAGTPVTIVACSAACSWYLIQTPSGTQVWSAASWFSVGGNLGTLPAR